MSIRERAHAVADSLAGSGLPRPLLWSAANHLLKQPGDITADAVLAGARRRGEMSFASDAVLAEEGLKVCRACYGYAGDCTVCNDGAVPLSEPKAAAR